MKFATQTMSVAGADPSPRERRVSSTIPHNLTLSHNLTLAPNRTRPHPDEEFLALMKHPSPIKPSSAREFLQKPAKTCHFLPFSLAKPLRPLQPFH